jgi:[acyl-carrier-protein] S-malonyltransferase
MLDPVRHAPGFGAAYAQVVDLLGFDPMAGASRDAGLLDGNAASSLLAVLAGALAADLQRSGGAPEPCAVAGYSVGQWTALYAAGAIDLPSVLSLVARRAALMDAAAAAAPPGGMLAVIGVPTERLRALCTEAEQAGHSLELANDNAPAQATLAGDLLTLDWAETRLQGLQPRVVRRLPVAGAWHSRYMMPAVGPLRELVAAAGLRSPRCPVIDNTTGRWLPEAGLPEALAAQVAAPVHWQQGMRTLIGAGVQTVLELGWGDVLTRFGFFIDRSVRHRALAPLPTRGR